MKKHAIIPVFIPHHGCPNDCIFCNQKIITARSKPVSADDVKSIIETHLSTLSDRSLEEIEIAFFGGSFTGIPLEQQTEYLKIADEYKQRGLIDKIHLSTRPDYISDEVLSNLKEYHVDVIELGVQSFDEDVLNLSKRGHTIDDVYRACKMIKEEGFTLGIQLMIGLPGDTHEKSVMSAKKAVDISPALARLYPTVILDDTQLAEMYKNGSYEGISEDEAVSTCKEMYRILTDAGITVMRVGLKSTDLVTNSSDIGGSYHPAFRQLVEGEIAREDMLAALKKLPEKISCVTFSANPKSFSNMIGHKRVNRNFFEKSFPALTIIYKADDDIPDGKYILTKAI